MVSSVLDIRHDWRRDFIPMFWALFGANCASSLMKSSLSLVTLARQIIPLCSSTKRCFGPFRSFNTQAEGEAGFPAAESRCRRTPLLAVRSIKRVGTFEEPKELTEHYQSSTLGACQGLKPNNPRERTVHL